MLAKDYIMRLVQDFAEALELYLKKKKKVDLLDNEYSNLYITYFQKKRSFFLEKTPDEIVEYMKATYEAKEYPYRIQMLTDLFYLECKALNFGDERLCEMTKALLQWTDNYTKTFSFERMQKIGELSAAITPKA